MAAKAVTGTARPIFTWGLVPHEFRDKAPHKTRYFKENFAIVNAPEVVKSEQGQVIYSEMSADLDQLMHTDWTYQFNPYWVDQKESHEMAIATMYEGGSSGIMGSIGKAAGLLPDLSQNTEEKVALKGVLSEFSEVVEWAMKTEAVYSQIFDQRFKLERSVWVPYERERILAGLIQMYLEYYETVPDKFKLKVKRELEYHIFSLRRMVPDCPNVKGAFPTFMA